MESDQTLVTSTDNSDASGTEISETVRDNVNETTPEIEKQSTAEDLSDRRLRTRLRRWLTKIWERECPLLPNDYFDNHGN